MNIGLSGDLEGYLLSAFFHLHFSGIEPCDKSKVRLPVAGDILLPALAGFEIDRFECS